MYNGAQATRPNRYLAALACSLSLALALPLSLSLSLRVSLSLSHSEARRLRKFSQCSSSRSSKDPRWCSDAVDDTRERGEPRGVEGAREHRATVESTLLLTVALPSTTLCCTRALTTHARTCRRPHKYESARQKERDGAPGRARARPPAFVKRATTEGRKERRRREGGRKEGGKEGRKEERKRERKREGRGERQSERAIV